jgi:amidase
MTTFTDYEAFDALGLAALVKRGVVSPQELLAAAIERIEERNPHLNAVIYKMYDQANATLNQPLPTGIFQGVPFLLKDFLADYAGVPLSSGSRFTQNWVPEQDGEIVTRIKNAGLVVVGKTNVPEFSLDIVTESSLFGPCRNPWDLTRSAGGSSGGSAAAVAAGIVPMAHGNDGAGSIRIPAAFCGLFGFKPSRGRTPSGSALMRLWENLVVEHVLTRSVRDSAAMLDVLAGPELGSSIALPPVNISYLNCLNEPLAPLKIALMQEPFFIAGINEEQTKAAHKAALLCEDLGHHVENVNLEMNSSDVAVAYIIVTAGEMAATIKRFSEKLGRKAKPQDLENSTAVLCKIGEHISAADFAWAVSVLDEASRSMAQFFQTYDVLITPTMGISPPKIGELNPNIFEQGILELLSRVPFPPLLRKTMEHAAAKKFAYLPYTPIFNISGQPAMSVPLFWDSYNLPLGIQFAAKVGDEARLLQLAYQLEQACPWLHRKAMANLAQRN